MNRTALTARCTHRRTAHPARRQAGLTLTEMLIVLTTSLVALATAVPDFKQARERRHVEGAAAQLETDIAFGRGLAVAQNRNLRLEIGSNEHGSCYTVHSGPAGACRCAPQGAVCDAGVELHRVVRFAAGDGVSVSANVRSMVFEPIKGTVTPTGTLRVQGAGGQTIHQIVNIMGRVRSCSPGAAVPGLRAC